MGDLFSEEELRSFSEPCGAGVTLPVIEFGEEELTREELTRQELAPAAVPFAPGVWVPLVWVPAPLPEPIIRAPWSPPIELAKLADLDALEDDAPPLPPLSPAATATRDFTTPPLLSPAVATRAASGFVAGFTTPPPRRVDPLAGPPPLPRGKRHRSASPMPRGSTRARLFTSMSLPHPSQDHATN